MPFRKTSKKTCSKKCQAQRTGTPISSPRGRAHRFPPSGRAHRFPAPEAGHTDFRTLRRAKVVYRTFCRTFSGTPKSRTHIPISYLIRVRTPHGWRPCLGKKQKKHRFFINFELRRLHFGSILGSGGCLGRPLGTMCGLRAQKV